MFYCAVCRMEVGDIEWHKVAYHGYEPRPSQETLDAVRRWECTNRGYHSWREMRMTGSMIPTHIFCECGVSLRVLEDEDCVHAVTTGDAGAHGDTHAEAGKE